MVAKTSKINVAVGHAQGTRKDKSTAGMGGKLRSEPPKYVNPLLRVLIPHSLFQSKGRSIQLEITRFIPDCVRRQITGKGSEHRNVLALHSLKAANRRNAKLLKDPSITNFLRCAAVATRQFRLLTIVLLGGIVVGLSGCSQLVMNSNSGVLVVTPTSASFGSVSVGQRAAMNISLLNRTLSSVQISQITIDGASFSIVNQAALPVTISSGASYVFAVQFAPSAAGIITGKITIGTSATTSDKTVVDLSGTGETPPPAAVNLSSLSCASGSITGLANDSCTVSLSGPAPSGGFAISLASNDTAVTIPASVTVEANAKKTSFTAAVAAVGSSQPVTLTATANGASRQFVLQLNPATTLLGINASQLSFGSVVLSSPATQTLTLSSAGTLPVSITSTLLTGVGFAISGSTLPATLKPGQTAALNVQFDPATAGPANGLLTIVSTSASNPTTVIPLSGTGVTVAVDLNWNAPIDSDDPVVGYRIYRAANGSFSYQLINASVQDETSFVDGAIESGTTYQYYVTSVDSAGVESTPSNTAAVAVP